MEINGTHPTRQESGFASPDWAACRFRNGRKCGSGCAQRAGMHDRETIEAASRREFLLGARSRPTGSRRIPPHRSVAAAIRSPGCSSALRRPCLDHEQKRSGDSGCAQPAGSVARRSEKYHRDRGAGRTGLGGYRVRRRHRRAEWGEKTPLARWTTAQGRSSPATSNCRFHHSSSSTLTVQRPGPPKQKMEQTY
jgi:hypothetical protein